MLSYNSLCPEADKQKWGSYGTFGGPTRRMAFRVSAMVSTYHLPQRWRKHFSPLISVLNGSLISGWCVSLKSEWQDAQIIFYIGPLLAPGPSI